MNTPAMQQRLPQTPPPQFLHDAPHPPLPARNADAPPERCLHQLIEAQAARTPHATALAFGDQRLTYRELDQRARLLAQDLVNLGARSDEPIGLFVERSLEMVVGLLAILKSGAAYLPIDPAQPDERIDFMLADARARIVLAERELVARVPDSVSQVICLDSFDWTRRPDIGISEHLPSPESLAYVIYTSGSTGRPKGVCIEHRHIVSYVLAACERFRFESGMQHAVVSTIAADLGNTVIFPALATGGCLHILPQELSESQGRLADYFRSERIDVLKIVPSHLAALQAGRNPQEVMPRRRLILGGEASRSEWVAQLRALAPQCEIHNHYGPTETTVGVLTYHAEGALPATQTHTLPLGKALRNSHVYILDERGEPVPAGTIGELCIGGRCVARGYLNRPELNQERFVPDPFSDVPRARMYRSGDLARCLPDGNVEFCGRIDRQIKLHGYRVELDEIEVALRMQAGVEEAAVQAPMDAAGGRQLVGYVVPRRREQPLWDFGTLHTLPPGVPVAHLNRNETDYIYREIFELQAYLRHGITIRDGDCIIDAGANIGLFTVFASRLARNLRIVSVEPNPAAFECLEANAQAWGEKVRCLPIGLSAQDGNAELVTFEGLSLLSGFHADAQKERATVERFVANQAGADDIAASGIGELIDDKLRTTTHSVEVRTLSRVIADEGIERIDLLKINAEKSELDVLRGIDERDWDRIAQLVVEIDQSEHVGPITALLEARGFDVLREQDPLLDQTELCYVYAIRPAADRRLQAAQGPGEHVREVRWDADVLTPALLRNALQERLPQYMVPASFVRLDRLPLTANGKIDRQALDAMAPAPVAPAQAFVPPGSETESALARIWAGLLDVDSVGIDDNFFELGGHSLLAIRMVSQIRDHFGVDLALRNLFEQPTVRGLAGVIDELTWLAQPKRAAAGGDREEIAL